MPSSEATTQAFQRALRAERRRNNRLGMWVRIVSVSIFLGLVMLYGVVLRLPAWREGILRVFLPYWALGLSLLLLTRRSGWLLERTGIAIAVLDAPATYLLVRGYVSRFPGVEAGPATFGLALFMYLVIVAQLTLDTRLIGLVAAVGAVLTAFPAARYRRRPDCGR
jgi:hypothetical protein